MAGKIEVGVFQAPGSTGLQDITHPNLSGVTPNAVIVHAGKADALSTSFDDRHAFHAIAGPDGGGGTSVFSIAHRDSHGLSSSSVHCRGTADTLIASDLDGDVHTGSSYATFDSFISGGVRVNWQNIDGSGGQYFVIVFFADFPNIYCDTVAINGSSTDVTDPGFEPTFVYCLTYGRTFPDNGAFVQQNIGASKWNGSSADNYEHAVRMDDGDPTADIKSYISNQRCAGEFQSWVASIGAYDASGFTVFANINPGGDEIAYLAVDTGSLGAWVGAVDSPTTTGTWSKTGVGFTPQFVLMGTCFNTSYQGDTNANTNDNPGAQGIAVWTEDDEACWSWASRDAQATMDTETRFDDQALHLQYGDGTAAFRADGPANSGSASMDADGWTLDVAQADGTVRKWWALAVESGAPSGGGQTITVGIATETDAAQSIGWSKSAPVGQAVESDLALALTAKRTHAIGLATESDAGLSVGWSKKVQVAQAIETDSALATTAAKQAAIAQALESDAALSVTASLGGGGTTITIGQASETDAALALTVAKAAAINQAEDTSSAFAVGAAKTLAVGLAAEADAAFAIGAAKASAIGLAEEPDTALAVSAAKQQAVGIASETDTAFSLTWSKVISQSIGQASETDMAFALTVSKNMAIGLAAETDIALSVSRSGVNEIVATALNAVGSIASNDFTRVGRIVMAAGYGRRYGESYGG